MVIPDEKSVALDQAFAEVKKSNDLRRAGVITDKERYNKVVDIWTHAGDEITKALFRTIEYNDGQDLPSPLFMMVDSGARGNRQQIKQLRKDLTREAASAAVAAAQDLLQKSTTDSDQDQLAEAYLDRLDEVIEERRS